MLLFTIKGIKRLKLNVLNSKQVFSVYFTEVLSTFSGTHSSSQFNVAL